MSLKFDRTIFTTLTPDFLDGWYHAFRERLRIIIPYAFRRYAVRMSRSWFGFRNLATWIVPRRQRQIQPQFIPTRESFFDSVTLRPYLSESEAASIVTRPVTGPAPARPDIICFSIIDWSFRHQRPQQIMRQFAEHGHRVFYLSVSRFTSPRDRSKFSIREIIKNVYEVALTSKYPRDIFGHVVAGADMRLALASLEELRRACNINEAIAYIMVPSWARVAIEARREWGWHVVYDCMDEWETFPAIKSPLLSIEKELVRDCDFLVVSAQRLYDKWKSYRRPMILARNAVDYEFFDEHCRPNPILSSYSHPLVGYFGAIAEWFDLELLAYVAERRPEYTFVILGGIFNVDVSPLRSLLNVHFLGHQPYETMPLHLYHFDACLIPFKINRITEATDPVKLYEYISAGKPVVSVNLPELEPFGSNLYLAREYEDFLTALDAAIAEDDQELRERRRTFARHHTWKERYERIYHNFASLVRRASIVVITRDNLALTRLCLESVFANTEYPNYEVVVVDNSLSDETRQYLSRLITVQSNLTVILNSGDYGFARACNQGIENANGEYIVLLNDDAVVPPGWLSRLLDHLADPAVGLAGCVSNFDGADSEAEMSYKSCGQMTTFANEYVWERHGQTSEIDALSMSCAAMRREVYRKVGALREAMDAGGCDGEEYSNRMRRMGYSVIRAEDVFVHHFDEMVRLER